MFESPAIILRSENFHDNYAEFGLITVKEIEKLGFTKIPAIPKYADRTFLFNRPAPVTPVIGLRPIIYGKTYLQVERIVEGTFVVALHNSLKKFSKPQLKHMFYGYFMCLKEEFGDVEFTDWFEANQLPFPMASNTATFRKNLRRKLYNL